MYPNIKAEMARNGLTQVEMAYKMGIPVHSLSRKLRGEVPFSVPQAVAVKKALGVDMPLEVLFKEE